MQNLKFMLLLVIGFGIGSCSPKVAKKMEATPSAGTTVAVKDTTPVLHPPVSIDGGIQMKYLYAGMPNDIKVNVEGGSSAHLIVATTNGTLTPADESKGRYSFSYKFPGMIVEIYAKDTVNKVTVAQTYEVIPLPAPDAYVWTYRKPLATKMPSIDALVKHYYQQYNTWLCQQLAPYSKQPALIVSLLMPYVEGYSLMGYALPVEKEVVIQSLIKMVLPYCK